MLKLKPILLGVISSIALFLVLLLAEAFVTDKLGKMNEPLLSNFSYVFMLVSVIVGGFVSALSARGRGLIYGAIVSGVWILLSLITSLILGAEHIVPVIVRAAGLLPAGIIGGGAGIYVSNKNEYM